MVFQNVLHPHTRGEHHFFHFVELPPKFNELLIDQENPWPIQDNRGTIIPQL